MSIKTTVEMRRAMYERHLAGETYAQLSLYYGLSQGCVRHWCRQQRDGKGVDTQWHRRAGGPLSRFSPQLRERIQQLKRTHPGWGTDMLLMRLKQELGAGPAGPAALTPTGKLPARASISRFLHSFPEFRRRCKPRPQRQVRPAPSRVHECWQIDFKQGIALGDGTLVNLHTVCDVVGEACLLVRVTPAGVVGGRVQRVKMAELQETFRQAFARWGTLPESIQTDNEPVFVGDTECRRGRCGSRPPADHFPGPFTLWLCGLGIQHLTIRPGRPTDNAEVERCHQTICNLVMRNQQYAAWEQLQQELDRTLEQFNAFFPSRADNCHGQPPLVAHPQLRQQPRRWRSEQEAESFDLQRIAEFLAPMTWRRRVGKTGQVCLGGHHRYYTVGKAYAQRDVFVRFDPSDRAFVFSTPATDNPQAPGVEICRRPAQYLTRNHILGCLPSLPPQPAAQLAFDFHSAEGVCC